MCVCVCANDICNSVATADTLDVDAISLPYSAFLKETGAYIGCTTFCTYSLLQSPGIDEVHVQQGDVCPSSCILSSKQYIGAAA